MGYRLVFTNGERGITLWHHKGFFKVTYGVQESSGLSQGQAAKVLGECFLDSLTREGKIYLDPPSDT